MQVAKLASRLLYSRSLLRNNNTAIKLQMFTSSLEVPITVVGVLPHVTRAPAEGFSNQICLLVDLCV